MKAHRTATTESPNWLSIIVAVIVVGVPFHAFLTVWLASGFGHYTELRLWKEGLLMIAAIFASTTALKSSSLQQKLRASRLWWLSLMYGGFTLVVGLVSWFSSDVTSKALAYGLLINLRFLVWFWVVWVALQQQSWLGQRWQRLVLWPAAIVCGIGLLQFFILPYDVLRHFGYSLATIFPYETINHNVQYQRVMSTLRGANPLGAYLVVIIALLVATWRRRYRAAYSGLVVAAVVTMFLTFSRAAWLGVLLSVGIVGLVKLRGNRYRKPVYYCLAALIIMLGAVFAAVRHDPAVQNALFHTEDKSKIAVSSNQGHSSALRNGLSQVWHEPLGRGPGTAGPASVYNQGKVRIAENYYLQIGQETGWLGLGLFVAITIVSLRLLWLRRADPLALGVFAAGIGLIVVNLLSHAWTDDTLAYVWWGLAAITLATEKETNRR